MSPARPPPDFRYGRNFPSKVITTRSPLGSGLRTIPSSKSMALMIPSPKRSLITAFTAGPNTWMISNRR